MTTTQELADGLVGQLSMMSWMARRCAEANKQKTTNHNLHSIVLEHGVGRFCTRDRWRGIRRGRWGECFSNSTHFALRNDRFIYCEGYGVRPEVGISVGLHAWLLDRENGYEVIDPTWRKVAGGVYLGIPFSTQYLLDSIMRFKVYGLIERWEGRHPVLTDDPATYLHAEAAQISLDFKVPNPLPGFEEQAA